MEVIGVLIVVYSVGVITGLIGSIATYEAVDLDGRNLMKNLTITLMWPAFVPILGLLYLWQDRRV